MFSAGTAATSNEDFFVQDKFFDGLGGALGILNLFKLSIGKLDLKDFLRGMKRRNLEVMREGNLSQVLLRTFIRKSFGTPILILVKVDLSNRFSEAKPDYHAEVFSMEKVRKRSWLVKASKAS